jgi:membrane protein DedA with SNARE-associated domain
MVTSNSYLDIFLALVLSTTVLPVPEELPVIGAGVVCGNSDTKYADDRGNPERVRWWIMLPVVIVGAVLGDIVLYTIGRLFGKKLLDLRWVQRRIVSPEKRASIERNFANHGIKVLLGVRLLPGIRGPVFLIAGTVRLPLWQFVLADAIYAIPIVNLMFWTAYWLTDQINVLVNVITRIEEHKTLVISHILAGVAGALIYHYLIVRRVPTGEAKIPPIIAKPAHAIEHALESAVDVVTRRHHHDKPPEDGEKPPDGGEKPPYPDPPKDLPPG